MKCKSDNECLPMEICKLSYCQHKPIFPLNSRDTLGFLCVLFTSTLASAAGIGGGSLLYPIYIVILGFNTHETIPLSKFTVFSSSLVTFFMSMNIKHPERNTFALDYNIAGMIIPMTLFGTSFGVILNKMLPFTIILISLSFVLIFSTYKSFHS